MEQVVAAGEVVVVQADIERQHNLLLQEQLLLLQLEMEDPQQHLLLVLAQMVMILQYQVQESLQ